MDDVKSNGEEDGELKLHEARLDFSGPKKEHWGVVVGWEGVGVGMGAGSKVATVSRLRDAGRS